MKKTAIMIDAGFLYHGFNQLGKTRVYAKDIYDYCCDLLKKPVLEGHELFRIYYYDCKPYGKKIRTPQGSIIDYGDKPYFRYKERLIDELSTMPNMACRLGELNHTGWKTNNTPVFKQKQVDIKIGLDISWLSVKKIVDSIILIAGDSDFIPVMKFARKEGLKIFLDTMGVRTILKDLKIHSDITL